jgi:site-specific recombinase XerD
VLNNRHVRSRATLLGLFGKRTKLKFDPDSSALNYAAEVSERGAPLSADSFNRMVKRAGATADLGIRAHAHMLRHACRFKLANDAIDTRSLQAYLGHRAGRTRCTHRVL